MDIQYNSGLVERKTHDGYTVYFGEELKGDKLLDEYLEMSKRNPFDFVKSVSYDKKTSWLMRSKRKHINHS